MLVIPHITTARVKPGCPQTETQGPPDSQPVLLSGAQYSTENNINCFNETKSALILVTDSPYDSGPQLLALVCDIAMNKHHVLC